MRVNCARVRSLFRNTTSPWQRQRTFAHAPNSRLQLRRWPRQHHLSAETSPGNGHERNFPFLFLFSSSFNIYLCKADILFCGEKWRLQKSKYGKVFLSPQWRWAEFSVEPLTQARLHAHRSACMYVCMHVCTYDCNREQGTHVFVCELGYLLIEELMSV